jgi:hypothetical protein
MVSTLAYSARAPGDPAQGPSLVSIGIAAGVGLLVLPALVVASVRLTQPGDPIVARMLAFETVLIAVAQLAISIVVVRRRPAAGIVGALVPAVAAGLVVAAGDVAGLSVAFQTSPPSVDLLSVVAYDVVLGVALALPIIVLLDAASECRVPDEKASIKASPRALIRVYERVLHESTCGIARWRVCALLAHQLVRRHIRRTLEAVQSGYARKALERGLDEAETRERQTIDNYLLAVPPTSRIAPIPTAATIFLLWELVPLLVAFAAAGAAWCSGGRWGLAEISEPIGTAVRNEAVASFIIDLLALAIAFPLLMLVLAPAIHRRDRLLSKYKVCEREVILMDDRLRTPRRSRWPEYLMAALPALPLALFGAAALPFALAGLFVYPSPEGPLGSVIQRADLMYLGPVTGVVLAQAFLAAAAAWIAWIMRTRKTTRVVFL